MVEAYRTNGPGTADNQPSGEAQPQFFSVSFPIALLHSISSRRKSMGAMPLCHLYLGSKGLISISRFFQEMLEKVGMIIEITAPNTGSRKIFMTVKQFVSTSF